MFMINVCPIRGSVGVNGRGKQQEAAAEICVNVAKRSCTLFAAYINFWCSAVNAAQQSCLHEQSGIYNLPEKVQEVI